MTRTWTGALLAALLYGAAAAEEVTYLDRKAKKEVDLRDAVITGPRREAGELQRPYVWQRAANALDALATGRARYFHRAASPAAERSGNRSPSQDTTASAIERLGGRISPETR